MDRVALEQWKGREVARLLTLVETERRYYQEIVSALPVGLAVVSRDGSIQSANRAFRQVFSLRAEDIQRRTLNQVLPDTALQSYIQGISLRAGDPPPVCFETPEHKLRVSVIPIRDWDDDTEVEALVILEDITGLSDQPRVEDVPALMWTADTSSLEFTVIGGEPHIPHPGFDSARLDAADRDRAVEFYRKALAQPGKHVYEYRGLGGESAAWYRDVFAVVPAAAGKPSKASGVVTEITERRISEKVGRQAARLDAVTSLAKTLSHDLNNPLMVVTGYGEEVLSSFELEDSRRKEVEEIITAAHRIARISGAMLNFTRKQADPAEPVLLAEVAARATEAVEGSTVRIPALMRAQANPAQLGPALAAIASAMRPAGPVSISARVQDFEAAAAEELPAGRYIDLTFASPNPADLIFDAIVSKNPVAPDLARTHALVREWGGGIWQSGNEVHVLIPAAPDAAPSGLPASEPGAPAQPPAVDAEPEQKAVAEPEAEPEPELETILVVEDEPGIRALVRKILQRQNYRVLEAGTPDEAVEIVSKHKGTINLLVTDMTLPQRNGRELAAELGRMISGLKVLYVSGYTDDMSVYDRELLPSGAAFLQKPFTLGSLLKRVRDVMDSPKEI